ncbi:MAG TPA: hypothetical protein PK459_00965 [Anaerolineaceae bacterium]|nr:hypothetical protein [Anaerolineaceae bacterium]
MNSFQKSNKHELLICLMAMIVVLSSCVSQGEKDTNAFNADNLLVSISETEHGCSQIGKDRIGLYNTRNQTFTLLLDDEENNYLDATWSPDYSLIAYVKSNSVEYINDDNLTGETSVWIMEPDGSNARQISKVHPNRHRIMINSGYCFRGDFINEGLEWSPDGRYLHYSFLESEDLPSVDIHYVIDVKTGTEIFAFEGEYLHFAWSPKGDYFGFIELGIPKVFNLLTGEINELPELQEPGTFVMNWLEEDEYPSLFTITVRYASVYSIAEKDEMLAWEKFNTEGYFIWWDNHTRTRYYFLREDNYDYLLDFKTGEKYEVDKQADDLINAASCAVIHQNIPDWPYMTYIDPETLNLYGLYLVDGKLESRLITEINRSAFPAPLFFRKIDFMN